jgi:hypothetical protein
LLLQLDRCNQLQPVSPAVISPHFLFGWCNWSPVLPSSTVARSSAYFKTCQTFFGEEKLMCGDFVVKNDDLFGVEIIRLTLFFLISLSRKMINDLLFWYYTHSYSYGRCLSSAVLSDFLSFFLFFPLTKRARAFQLVG